MAARSTRSIIHATGLSKTFGSLVAVDAVSIDVAEGQVFALLGPNGAGKTTMVRMLTSLISRTGGSAEVAGCELGNPSDELRLRRSIGLLPENVGLYESSSAYENLEFFGRLHRVESTALRASIERLLRLMGLWEKRDLPVSGFSKGMKQRVAIARAVVHDPTLLFLDEPTANLDPEAAKTVREFILQLKGEGRTIFLNTHNLDEAERICDQVGLLRTRLLTVGSPTELRDRLWGSRTAARLVEPTPQLIEAIRRQLGPRRVDFNADTLLIDVKDPERENPQIADAIHAAGGRLAQLTQVSHTLEEVYLKLIHEGEGAP